MSRGMAAIAAMAALILTSVASKAQAPAWDPQPWLEDLAQTRTAFETKYSNLEWLLTEREFDLAGLFRRAEAAIRQGRSDADAIAVFNRLVSRIDDGHVSISWPRVSSRLQTAAAAVTPPPPATVESFCRARGFDPSRPGVGPALTGYKPIDNSDVLPAGIVPVGGARAGIVRISKFEPGGSPSLCAEAVAALAIPLDRPCDDSCHDRILTRAYQRLTASLEDRLTRLRAAGATILIVDVTGNGGGSEWVQAVARTLSRRQLVAQRMGFVRGPHWAGTWTRLSDKLREFARTASSQDRRRLLAWAAEADAARTETQKSCPPTGGCPWVGKAGFATGLVGSAPSGAFRGKEWGPWVFNPSQYPYRDGVWDGPVIVLVDDETGSAAEELPALLQDNRAGLVVGSRTAGLGCGHTWGGSPTRLKNSGATLQLPDCVRFRADGSNEVRGIIPDQVLGWRARDGSALKARLLEAALPTAVRQATQLYRGSASR